ncbi:DNA-binding domain-containing protein [Hoeflea poritis]|uniref:DNA-binding domain-containing protein n=1 Tax=Hoeflea poritis TaxID=2993659 RepID=A0ABT4VST3_9HYPH|nr:DNA-binding domain-containing protein [Hoeflea poritis]MDA4847132.1 DNA-binding domain-containing protein [Hoeflea poritis]
MPRPDSNSEAAKTVRTVTLGRFSDALLDPEQPTPAGIVGPDGKKADKRFDVYRNNVTVSLVGALAEIYPAVHRLVGDDFFRAMARTYVRSEQPKSPLLFRYGDDFADFLEGFEPAKKLVYLPDVARLERAWLDAFHAADAPPLDPAALAAIAPDELAEQRFKAHPATRVVCSRFAAVSIFSANRSGADLSGIDPAIAEDGLVTRRDFDVEVRTLPEGAAAFLQALVDGNTLGEAAEAAVAVAQKFDLAAAIGAMLEAGAFTAIATKD